MRNFAVNVQNIQITHLDILIGLQGGQYLN